MTTVVLHSVRAPAGSRLERLLDRASPYGALRPLVSAFPMPIARISGPPALLEEAAGSLPEGAAWPEAVAVRLRRRGIELSWGEPEPVADASSFVRLCRARGASSVELVRSDPSLLTELQLGAFFHAYWRRRLLRRAAIGAGLARVLTRFTAAALELAADLAFWSGVRSVATPGEWHRLARSSYVVFYYHRIGGGGWPGKEHLDLRVRRFELQLRLLRLLGFRALTPEELLAFHGDPTATLSPRSYVLTADDALRDAVDALGCHGELRPQVFVNTSAVGASPWWAFGKSVADWDELEAFARAGGVVGSHCRGHPRLTELDSASRREELEASRRELGDRFPETPALLAYPHGLHDEGVVAAARAAGYEAAFTTEPGRNGAGIDRHCLRRVGLKDWDAGAAFLWKAVTGELLPWRWEQRRRGRLSRRSAPAGAPAAGPTPE